MVQIYEGQEMQPGTSYAESEQNQTEKIKAETEKRVRPFLSKRKDRLVEQLNEAAVALRDSGSQMENNRSSDLVRMSAQKIQELGGYLERRDIDELVDDLQEFARARPWAIMGGAFVIGLAAARFLKAGSR